MDRYDVKFLDLPDEILLIILKKLNNTDVLYFLLNINNHRLNSLAQENIFGNVLNFLSIDNLSSNDCLKLDRFCTDILPKIHDNVKYFILKPILMERILLATDYSNLTKLKLFNFKKEIVSCYFTNESSLQYIFQQQITDLILVNDDKYNMAVSLENYTRNVYVHILNFCENLTHLTVTGKSYPALSLCHLPSNTFSSSILTYLNITVRTLDDCLYLLDGRLKQLTTLIVEISLTDSTTIIHNMENVPNLKCFSFKCYDFIDLYDYKILPLLRRMSCLEKLTLYLRINDRNRLIDDTHIENEIVTYMPRLYSFTFYIFTSAKIADLEHNASDKDMQQTYTNIKQQPIVKTVHRANREEIVCSIFSLPFQFNFLKDIGYTFPDTKCSYVTYLLIQDIVPFNREYFIRTARNFPLLKNLRLFNIIKSQSSFDHNTFSAGNNQLYTIAEYPHLISLDVLCAHGDYLEEFLNEKKAYVPCLTQLKLVHNAIQKVTKNFTREDTRRNCANIQRLITFTQLAHTKDFYAYFPLL